MRFLYRVYSNDMLMTVLPDKNAAQEFMLIESKRFAGDWYIETAVCSCNGCRDEIGCEWDDNQ